MAKKAKPTTEITAISKNHTWNDAQFNPAFIFFPGKNEWRQRLIFTMRDFFNDDDHIIFEEFLIAYKIPRATWQTWYEKYPDINSAYIDVKECIAVNRKKKTMNFKLHYQSGFRDMHCYDSKWAVEVDQYHAALAKKDESTMGDIHVHIDEVPKTDKVPDKPQQDFNFWKKNSQGTLKVEIEE